MFVCPGPCAPRRCLRRLLSCWWGRPSRDLPQHLPLAHASQVCTKPYLAAQHSVPCALALQGSRCAVQECAAQHVAVQHCPCACHMHIHVTHTAAEAHLVDCQDRPLSKTETQAQQHLMSMVPVFSPWSATCTQLMSLPPVLTPCSVACPWSVACTGFLAFLHLVASHPWRATPLLVDPSQEVQQEQRRTLQVNIRLLLNSL
jgi:hypothetical protein